MTTSPTGLKSKTRRKEQSAAVDQQIATNTILRAMAQSPADLQPVLSIIAESAAKLCKAYDSAILLREGEVLAIRAHFGPIPIDTYTVPIARDFVNGRAFIDRGPVQIEDLQMAEEFPGGREFARRQGHRTILAVPLLRGKEAIGTLAVRRREVLRFSPNQVELLRSFADQAVIAIEIVRLSEEAQQRNQELSATSEVLGVIAQSPTNLRPVFEVIAESAAKLCNADDACVQRFDGTQVYLEALYGLTPEAAEATRLQFPRAPSKGFLGGRAILSGKIEAISDYEADPDYDFKLEARVADTRSALAVPMVKDGRPIGAIVLDRSQPGIFPERQVELLKTFANQAVIALENVRLFDEVKSRNSELTESLDAQTATSSILRVIATSPTDIQPVLNAVVESAARLCDAYDSIVFLHAGDALVLKAHHGPIPVNPIQGPRSISRDWVSGRVFLDGRLLHVADLQESEEFPRGREMARRIGYRTILSVPLLRNGKALGAISVRRLEIHPFEQKQIDLLTTFADQAVIAIENVRLFNEVQTRTEELSEALQQQTTTADVLKVISRSAFNLQTVLDALLESAARLCHAEMADMLFRTNDGFRYVSMYGYTPEQREFMKALPFTPGRGSAVGRVAADNRPVSIADVLADPEYTLLEAQKSNGFRSLLAVPLLSEGELQGIMVLQRKTVSPFNDRQIDLVSTFADQAVIAVKNVRLFEEVQERTQELSRSLEELKTAQARLIQSEKLASLGQLTAGIAHEIKNPLNFVNNFATLSMELIDEIADVLKPLGLDEKQRETLSELMATLGSNLGKIAEHGKRADSIVRNMLLHSRQSGGERRRMNINTLIEESLNLAYHGARAERQDFQVFLAKELDPKAGEIDVFPQEMTRVLLNLFSNAFYATTRRKSESDDPDYEPTVAVKTRSLGDQVEIRIRDNGTGVPVGARDKIFNPFFTTKPTGEGTGLGLSLSYDIVVKQHGGSIEFETAAGQFTEFIVVLPRNAGLKS